MYIAHRGVVNNSIKENTLEAFKEAINNDKYYGFELDIRESRDHEFVVVHDFFENGLLIKHSTSEELINKGIVKLESVLNLETDKIILIEIKDFEIDINKLNDLLNKYSNKKIYVMSFNKGIIKRISKLDRTYKIGILNYVLNSELNYNEYDFICLLNEVVTDDLINYFTSKKIEVFLYGIRNKTEDKDNIYMIIDDRYTT